MLKPHPMSSVIITGPLNVQESVIKELHDLKILHIVDHSKNSLADIGMPLESSARLSEILVKIRALISSLGIRKGKTKFELRRGVLEIESSYKKISEEGSLNAEELKKIEEQLARLHASRQELEILEGIKVPLENFTPYKRLAYFIGYAKSKESVEKLRKGLSDKTEKFMIFESSYRKKNVIVLFVDSEYKGHASDLLQKTNFSHLNFTNIFHLKGTAASNFKRVSEEMAKLEGKKQSIKKSQERLAREYGGFLIASEKFLGEQLEKAEAPLRFASTPTSFLIKGWVPDNELHRAIDRISRAAKNKVFIHFKPASLHDEVPVKLKNPRAVRPFEFFMDLYSIPSYKEIDPTFFVFLTFPIFFGIMLGDMGYGALTLGLFWLLKKKMQKAKNFFNILLLASFVTILFGFLFGEFFGKEIIHPVVRREHEMFKLMFIAIAIGVIHVNIGLVIGFINELKHNGFMHAVYAKASWIVLEIGAALLVLSYMKKIAISPLLGAIFLGASILMLIKGEGVKGLIELPSILTNIMSYARLMAIGLSSVILAVIINESATEFIYQGGFFILIGILVLIIGHAINIMLGLLGSFLHSLRLHYVEFFSKFFHGGAKKYQPFGAREE